MPCRDYMAEDEYRQEQYRELQEKRKTVDQLTRLLCSACKTIEALRHTDRPDDPQRDMAVNLQKWWAEHSVLDAAREEQARKNAVKARKTRETKLRKKKEKAEIVTKLSKKEAEKIGIGSKEYLELAEFLMRTKK